MGRVPHCCWSPFMQIWPAPLVNRHSGSRTPGMWKLCILGQASLDHLLLVSQHFTSAVWPCEEVDFLWTERNQQFFCCIRRAWYFCVNNNTTVANAANAHRRTLYLEQQTFRYTCCVASWSYWINTAEKKRLRRTNTRCDASCTLLHCSIFTACILQLCSCPPPPPPSWPLMLTIMNNKTHIKWRANEQQGKSSEVLQHRTHTNKHIIAISKAHIWINTTETQ